MDGARAYCSRSSILVRSWLVCRNIARSYQFRLAVIAACHMAWSPDPTGIITPLHVMACAMHSQLCPPLVLGALRCCRWCGLSPLEVIAPPDGCCCVSRRGCPPSSSHYHLPPRIPPLELTAEPSRPALYRSGCGRAEETKPHVLCGCAIRPVRWWRWQKMRLPISNMRSIARNMEPARPASVGSCRAWGFPNPQRLCGRSMIRSVAGVLAWW